MRSVARKSVFTERTKKELDIDSAVAEAIDARENSEQTQAGKAHLTVRAFLSQKEWKNFKAKCAIEGVAMSLMLGDLIRQFLESASS